MTRMSRFLGPQLGPFAFCLRHPLGRDRLRLGRLLAAEFSPAAEEANQDGAAWQALGLEIPPGPVTPGQAANVCLTADDQGLSVVGKLWVHRRASNAS